MDHDDAELTLLIYNVWYAYIYKGHHKAKKGRVHSRRQKGLQGARKGQQGVAPCYLHLAGALWRDMGIHYFPILFLNIYCGYSLELPCGGSKSTLKLCFERT